MNTSKEDLELFIPTIEDITFVPSEFYNTDSKSICIDDGIYYGLGFFETILVLHKAIFLDEHLQRLNTSLETFNIPTYITAELVNEAIALCNISNMALKILVTASNIIISVRPLTYGPQDYEKGASLMFSKMIRSSQSFLVNHKSVNYGDMILSLRHAHSLGFKDCIFFNEKGYLTETAIANIFIIKNEQLMTPPINEGLLPGTVRRYLIEHYEVVEKPLTLTDLVLADAVFITNSLVGILPVATIDINKDLIKSLRLIQTGENLPEQVAYLPHERLNKLSDDYQQYIQQL